MTRILGSLGVLVVVFGLVYVSHQWGYRKGIAAGWQQPEDASKRYTCRLGTGWKTASGDDSLIVSCLDSETGKLAVSTAGKAFETVGTFTAPANVPGGLRFAAPTIDDFGVQCSFVSGADPDFGVMECADRITKTSLRVAGKILQ